MADAILRLIDVYDHYEGIDYNQYFYDLINGTFDEEAERKKQYFYFESENTEYEFELELLSEKYIRLKLYITDDSQGKHEELVFEADTDLFELASQVVNQFEFLLLQYGFSGYYARWEEEFPVNSYMKLKSYVLINSSSGILKKQVPNLGIPFKIELQILNKLTAVNTDEDTGENLRRAG